jgi:hypothetical protein
MSKPAPKKQSRISKLSIQAEHRNDDTALWADVPEEVMAKILLLADSDVGLSLSKSKDQGALGLTIHEDGEHLKKWFKPLDAGTALKGIFETFGIDD